MAFIKRASQQPAMSQLPRETIMELLRESPELIAAISSRHEVTHKAVVKKPLHQSNVAAVDTIGKCSPPLLTNEAHSYSRLPKLALSTFNGDQLEWQSYWDSFYVAVHINPSLTGAQKLKYLCTLLQGDAGDVIGGFPLTDNTIMSILLIF